MATALRRAAAAAASALRSDASAALGAVVRSAREPPAWPARQARSAEGVVPRVSSWAAVHETAVVAGRVAVGDDAVVGVRAVLRGDTGLVSVEGKAVVGDGAVVTVTHPAARDPVTGLPLRAVVGRNARVGAGAVLDACVVEPDAVIGERAVVGRGALVEAGAVVGDDTVVPPGRRVPAKEIWRGNPATFVGVVEEGH